MKKWLGRFSKIRRGICLFGGLMGSFIMVSDLRGQESKVVPPPSEVSSNNARDFTIRIDVKEIQIDAVVLDKKGKQVTDLKAEDFEIYQDKKRQKITFCTYLAKNHPAGRTAPRFPSISTPLLPKEKLQRTIVFLVDDFAMTFEQVYWARQSLQKFVETQMQPGDLVSIMRTNLGLGYQQMFSSNPQHLLTIINRVRWNGAFLTDAGCTGGG
jgi:VWFA-related protein